MDRQGFEHIEETFKESSIGNVDITPEPGEGENVRYITIRPYDRTRAAAILNVLDKAGLIYDPLEDEGPDDKPLLEFMGVDAFAVTFEDINFRP